VEESEMNELPTYRTILFATDGSGSAELAERHALALALKTGARLEGIYVVDRRIATQFVALESGVLEEMKRGGQLALDRLTQRAHQVGISVETYLLEGRAGPTIVDQAERRGADLLVLGSHGQGALADILLGSVSLYVLHHSPIPVCMVRPSNQKGT
jgi:nucleotide-binding universal stress UspA family protein